MCDITVKYHRRFLRAFLLKSQLLANLTKNMCSSLSFLVKSSFQASTWGHKCNGLFAQCIMHIVTLLFLSSLACAQWVFYLKHWDDVAIWWLEMLWNAVIFDLIIIGLYFILWHFWKYYYCYCGPCTDNSNVLCTLALLLLLMVVHSCIISYYICKSEYQTGKKSRIRWMNLIEKVFLEPLWQYWFFHKPLLTVLVFAALGSISPLSSLIVCAVEQRNLLW